MDPLVFISSSQHPSVPSIGGPSLYVCRYCNQDCITEDSYLVHVDSYCLKKPNKCEKCQKVFQSSAALQRHLLSHPVEPRFQCNFCNKLFRHASTLCTHKKIHTGLKPFKCDVCSKEFNRSVNLKAHKLLHSQERPFICDVCQKGFVARNKMMAHAKKHHSVVKSSRLHGFASIFKKEDPTSSHDLHSLPDPLRTRNDLTDVRGHAVESDKPYKCSACDKTFTKRYPWLVHNRIHTGERPYECDQCHKTFAQKPNLTTHYRRIHGGRPP